MRIKWLRTVKYFTPLLVIIVWEMLTRFNFIDATLFPAPSEIFKTMIELAKNGDLILNAAPSLKRVLLALITACGLGIPFGLFLGCFKMLYESFSFLIDFLRSISPILLITFAIIWFGTNDLARIFVMFYGLFFIILLNTLNGVLNTDRTLIDAARLMDANVGTIFQKVIIPSALPSILTGIRLSISIAWVVLIPVEMLAANSGLGFMVLLTMREFLIKQMYAYAIYIAVIAYLMNQIILYIGKKGLIWKEESTLGTL